MSTTADIEQAADLDDADIRALSEHMTVLADHGKARDAPGLYVVISEWSDGYLVDLETGSCECPHAHYRDPEGGCKHVRRVQFAAGERDVPGCLDTDADLTVYGGGE
jgi:hypothetical protein